MAADSRPQIDMTIEEGERLITNANILMRSGKSPEWIRHQWIESGVAEPSADLLLKVLTEDLPKAQRKSLIKFWAGIAAAPVLVLLAIFAIPKIVSAAQGPNASQIATQAADAACGQRSYSVGVIEADGEVLLVGGQGQFGSRLINRSDPRFHDLVLDGSDLTPTRVLCTSVTKGEVTRCEGYYSAEIIAAVESTETIDDALVSLYGLPDGELLVAELMAGGTTINAEAATLQASLVQLSDGTRLGSSSVGVAADCPDEHSSYSYSTHSTPSVKASPDAGDLAIVVRDLTGIEL